MIEYPHDDWPRTVDEAVDRLLAQLSQQDKETIRQTPEGDLINLHFGLGTFIRNTCGLWEGNDALLASCGQDAEDGFIDPDDASSVVIEALWQRLRTAKRDG